MPGTLHRLAATPAINRGLLESRRKDIVKRAEALQIQVRADHLRILTPKLNHATQGRLSAHARRSEASPFPFGSSLGSSWLSYDSSPTPRSLKLASSLREQQQIPHLLPTRTHPPIGLPAQPRHFRHRRDSLQHRLPDRRSHPRARPRSQYLDQQLAADRDLRLCNRLQLQARAHHRRSRRLAS